MDMATNHDTSDAPAQGLKQQSIPGMGHPDVEKLLAAMGTAELTVFRFEEDGEKFIAKIKHGKTKVSVRKEKNDDQDEE